MFVSAYMLLYITSPIPQSWCPQSHRCAAAWPKPPSHLLSGSLCLQLAAVNHPNTISGVRCFRPCVNRNTILFPVSPATAFPLVLRRRWWYGGSADGVATALSLWHPDVTSEGRVWRVSLCHKQCRGFPWDHQRNKIMLNVIRGNALQGRWSVVVSGLSLVLRTALNLLPDSLWAGLQSYFMLGETVVCEKQRAFVAPGKRLRIHF